MSTTMYKAHLLATIKDMIEEQQMAMKTNGNGVSDMLEGRVCALRELAVELELCAYEELL